jgi:internalin A
MKTRPFLAILMILPFLFTLSCDNNGGVLPSGENHEPNEPSNPSPADSATGVDTNSVTLSWTCTDPDGDDLTYSLYWRVLWIWQSATTFTNITTNSYTISNLSPGTIYQWRVHAEDEYGETEAGPYWIFTTQDVIVHFTDINLELSIRQAISKPTGDIYASDINTLPSFYASQNGISSLTGIQYMIALNLLNISNNLITDISPLTSLHWLDDLELHSNQITDISPLSGTPSVQYLMLSDNQITDISSLSELTLLRTLYLDNNQISNISALAEDTLLSELLLDNNNISDISPLANLALLEYLTLGNNQITDISALSGLFLIESLYLNNNQINNISPLSNLVLLRNLQLDSNQVSNIQPLVNNPGISYGDVVYLRGNPLDSLSINIYIPELEARGVSVYF